MNYKNSLKILHSRKHTLFLLSQTALSLGDTFQFVATVFLLMKFTNSGLTTGFSIICSALPSLFFSLKAGSLGDRYSPRKVMIVLDILRGLFVLLFLICKSKQEIILVLLGISFLNVVYVPSKNKLLMSIFRKDRLLDGNSLLTGLNGIANIIGPTIAGICILTFGTNLPFIGSAATYFLSVFCLLGIGKDKEHSTPPEKSTRTIREGLHYCAHSSYLRKILLIISVIEFSTVSVNIAFYSFAFDVLKVSSRTWGLILSILYGMSFFSMLLLLTYKKWFDRQPLRIIYGMLLIVSAVWFTYSHLRSVWPVFFLEMIEGWMLSTANTLLLSRYLLHCDFCFSSRMAGIRDIVANSAKLLGVLYTTLILFFCQPDMIFKISAILLFLFATGMMFHAKIPSKEKSHQ